MARTIFMVMEAGVYVVYTSLNIIAMFVGGLLSKLPQGCINMLNFTLPRAAKSGDTVGPMSAWINR